MPYTRSSRRRARTGHHSLARSDAAFDYTRRRHPMAIPALELLGATSPIRVAAETLARRAALPPLAPTKPHDDALEERLRGLNPEQMLGDGARVASAHDAMAVVSGLLLWNDS